MMKKYWPLAVIAAVGLLVILAGIVSLRTRGLAFPVTGSRPLPPALTPMPLTELTLPGGPLTGPGQSRLPVLAAAMPEFAGITRWLNSEPLAAAELRGRVVLIDFWTYSCINCIRTLPYITDWYRKYRDWGLVIVGVHTPEFDFEKRESNVRQALARHGIEYPVALDNDYATWNAYDNHYWPAKYLFDARGRLRYFHFGEGEYDETERNIQELLAEAGTAAPAELSRFESTIEFGRIGTPETYLGYGRMEYLGSPEPVLRDREQDYSAAADPRRNRFYFDGRWMVESERSVAAAPGARIVYRYQASTANLVMGPSAGAVRAEVRLEGRPVPEELRGADLVEQDGRTYVTISEDRLYGLIDARGDYATRLLEIIFLDPGLRVYAFTFG